MSHYGDIEAHRCILREIVEHPTLSARLTAYLKAAVMGAQGFRDATSQLRAVPGAMEQPGPCMRAILSLLSLTLLASGAKTKFQREAAAIREFIGEERKAVQLGRSSAGTAGDRLRDAPAAAPSFSLDLPTSSGKSVRENTAGLLWTSLSNEQATDMLNYCEAYANYLDGFSTLWYELFGPHYTFEDSEDSPQQTGGMSTSPGESPFYPCQVPAHLYAVRWDWVLTTERREWFKGLHLVVKEILLRIMLRELPLEMYVLFIMYANLSLRVYLLEAIAEVFRWTSHFVDVIYYAQVTCVSYRIQCEMARLQTVWASFELFDPSFLKHCREFNKHYTESQGAFSETKYMDASESAPWTPSGSSTIFGSALASQLHLHPGPPHSRLHHRVAPLSSSGEAATAEAPAASVVSSTPEEDALSSSSENALPLVGTRRAVYVPLFHTCCYFTWILQRVFWSVYGRSSLLFQSCLDLHTSTKSAFVSSLMEAPPRSASPAAPHRSGKALRQVRSAATAAATAAASSSAAVSAPAEASGRGVGFHTFNAEGALLSVTEAGLYVSSALPQTSSSDGVATLPRIFENFLSRIVRPKRASGLPQGSLYRSPSCPMDLDEWIDQAEDGPACHSTGRGRGSLLHNAIAPTPPTASCEGCRMPHQTSAEELLPQYVAVEEEEAEERESSHAVVIAPFFLSYSHRAEEVALYADPSSFTSTSCNTAFFEEFNFLRQTGCYVLSHGIRSITCYPQYSATLLILTNNATRPGRTTWYHNKYTTLSWSREESDQLGMTPWVLNAVIPRSRLSEVEETRTMQEKALLEHLVFQLAGSTALRHCFTAMNSVFFVLNCDHEMDGGRLFYAIHLHVPPSEGDPQAVLDAEKVWAFRQLGELHVGWAMSCTCNEALRVALAVGSG